VSILIDFLYIFTSQKNLYKAKKAILFETIKPKKSAIISKTLKTFIKTGFIKNLKLFLYFDEY